MDSGGFPEMGNAEQGLVLGEDQIYHAGHCRKGKLFILVGCWEEEVK